MDREQGHWRRDIEERLRKQHEVMFEACKHFTTLNTAAVLIAVAIFRATVTGLSAVLWQLFFLGLSPSETNDFEFEEVGSDITVSPESTTACDQQVNQAASASG